MTRKPEVPVAIGIVLALIFMACWGCISYRNRRIVQRVIDGDTVVLASGERIRLLEIDAPERGEPGAAEATAMLTNLVLGRKVYVKREGKDYWGRTLARLKISEGTLMPDVGQRLLDAGVVRRWEKR